MKPTFQFRSHLTLDGEILAQTATFLPIASGWLALPDEVFTLGSQQTGVFLPVLSFNRKKLTVAQPLLKGELR